MKGKKIAKLKPDSQVSLQCKFQSFLVHVVDSGIYQII